MDDTPQLSGSYHRYALLVQYLKINQFNPPYEKSKIVKATKQYKLTLRSIFKNQYLFVDCKQSRYKREHL